MNTTPTVPRTITLQSLTSFSKAKAHTQLLRWTQTTSSNWSAASTDYMYTQDLLDDAKFVLSEARAAFKARKRQQLDEDDDFSEAEWCDEDLCTAQTELKRAKVVAAMAEEMSRRLNGEKIRARKGMDAFLHQFPEFAQVARTTSTTTTSKKRGLSAGVGDEDYWTAAHKAKRARTTTTTNPSSSAIEETTTEQKTRKAQMLTWLAGTKVTLANRTTMTAFPTPPPLLCTILSCRAATNAAKLRGDYRALNACEHIIQLAFEDMDAKRLRRERHEWHPDRFAVCRGAGKVASEVVEGWQMMAGEVFKAVSEMMR
ncbi:hypothetical protein LTR86_009522 [Recurvomyces mirabilis]|nr:hypothetical protein LTR86_009522 [Recurvomyces mirabilis]